MWFVDPQLQGVGFGVRLPGWHRDGRRPVLLHVPVLLAAPPTRGCDLPHPHRRTPTASADDRGVPVTRSCPAGLAFGASGRLYASLFLANQVVVLDPDGTEERRFPSKEANARQEIPYDQPGLLALDGDGWLLVGNEALVTPEHSAILKAFVDDTRRPPRRAVTALTGFGPAWSRLTVLRGRELWAVPL